MTAPPDPDPLGDLTRQARRLTGLSATLVVALGYLLYVHPYVQSPTLVGRGTSMAPFSIAVLAAPYAVVAWGLIPSRDVRWRFARGLAIGGGVLLIVLTLAATAGRAALLAIAASFMRPHLWPPLGYLFLGTSTALSATYDVLTPVLVVRPIGPFLLLCFVVVQVLLAGVAGRLRAAAEIDEPSRARARRAIWSVVGAVVPLCIGVPVQHLQIMRLHHAAEHDLMAYEGLRPDQLSARKALLRLTGCVQGYAARDSLAGYPRDLAAVGPRGTGCLADSLVAGRAGPYRLTYLPAAATGTGHTAGYRASAQFLATASAAVRRAASSGRPIGYVTDASGAVYQSAMPSPDGASVRPDTTLVAPMIGNVVRVLAAAHDCLGGAYRRGLQPARGFPRELHERPIGNCLLNGNTSNSTTVNEAPFAVLRLTYVAGRVVAPDSVPRTFVLEARPLAYPLTGARSFLVDESGRIHSTAADRAATRGDPTVQQCELDVGSRCQLVP
jgi:hypothetical protein